VIVTLRVYAAETCAQVLCCHVVDCQVRCLPVEFEACQPVVHRVASGIMPVYVLTAEVDDNGRMPAKKSKVANMTRLQLTITQTNCGVVHNYIL